eukprot:TRINITY_DN1442_c0_g1_i1.p1 TRINITY_DN1442_c0_g1~~TRINITY_DN1442_c0_g1_i1.p1  ORF type:complete len:156 (-),score=20.79 TRINITY_DN1442_c0_g1_i1:488-955(-)
MASCAMLLAVSFILFGLANPAWGTAGTLPEGLKCFVGGDVMNPEFCASGLECVLFDEGDMPVDLPGRGYCRKPGKTTCFDTYRQLYFSSGTKFTGQCGKCVCKKGKVKCAVNVVDCLVDPCLNKKCPKFPTTECISNYCGGCKYKFYLNGVKVKC